MGATVSLVIRGQQSQWTVVGVIPAVLASAFVARDAWASVVGSSSVTRVVVAALDTNLVAQGELRRLAQQELAGHGFEVSSGLLAENRASVEDHLLMVAEFLSVMGWLMIVVGGLGLASTMSLAVLERTREIGVLRAIGARHGAIHLIVQVEGLVVAILSWAIAILLSAPMAAVLGAAFGRVFFKTPVKFVPDPVGILVWLGLVVMVSVLACAWPAIRATRISARAALAYE